MLLETIREKLHTKFAQVLLALITVPFALWGIESYIRQGDSQTTVAKVAGATISFQAFDEQLKRQQDQYRQMFGKDYNAAMFDGAEMRNSVLDQMINQRLIQRAAGKSNARVPDVQLAQKIRTEAAFQENGQFSQKLYDDLVKRQFGSAAVFESRLREDLENQAYRDAVSESSFVSRAVTAQFARVSEQSRDVSVINLNLDQYKAKAAIDASKVKEYYDKNLAEFTTPEQVKVEYIEVSIDGLAASATIKPEAVAKYYTDNKDRYRQKEERKASHVLIAVAKDAKDDARKAAREKAERIAETLRKAPAQLAEIARKESQDPGSAAQGGDLGFFGRGVMVPPFDAAVFKANKDEILGPIETDFGYHVIKVTDIRPEKVKTLDEARPEIEGELKKQEANQKFADVSQKFTDVVFTQPSSLKAASEATGISPKVSPFFSKQFAPVPVLNNPKLLGEIFADDVKKNGKNTSAVEVQPNVLVAARVLEAKPAVTRTFDEVKVGIEAKLTREAQTRLATEEGEAKLKDLREGKAVAGLSWPAELSVSRDKPGGLPPDLVDKVLRADANKVPVYVGGSGPGGGYALVRISKVNEVAIDDAKRKTYEERARSSRQGAEFATLLNSLRQTADISVRRELIEKKAATP